MKPEPTMQPTAPLTAFTPIQFILEMGFTRIGGPLLHCVGPRSQLRHRRLSKRA
jgi:hypothetical protein